LKKKNEETPKIVQSLTEPEKRISNVMQDLIRGLESRGTGLSRDIKLDGESDCEHVRFAP